MRARTRNFRTSGVVLCLKETWFANASLRRALADWIRDVFLREYSVSPQDVGSAGTNISVVGLDGGGVEQAHVVIRTAHAARGDLDALQPFTDMGEGAGQGDARVV